MFNFIYMHIYDICKRYNLYLKSTLYVLISKSNYYAIPTSGNLVPKAAQALQEKLVYNSLKEIIMQFFLK